MRKEFLLNKKEYLQTKDIGFSQYLKSKRKDILYGDKQKPITTRELASEVGIGYEQFRKMINGQKPLKRDCIIAICFVLKLDLDDVNKALSVYNSYPPLNEYDPRDDMLIELLEEQFTEERTLEEVNQILEGENLSKLVVIAHHGENDIRNKKNLPYRILKRQISTYAEDALWSNIYEPLSLLSEYSLDNYRFVAEMWLDNPRDKKRIYLCCSTKQEYELMLDDEDYTNTETFTSISDTREFKEYFADAEIMARKERRKILAILNDTKNYRQRCSAKLLDDRIYLFSETFNYSVPELNEYYFYDYHQGKEALYVFHTSVFMRHYLSETDYRNYYGNNKEDVPVKVYSSLEDLEEAALKSKKLLLKTRLYYFRQLKEACEKLQNKLKAKERFINNLNLMCDAPDIVCRYYGVEKEFDCEWDEEGYLMFANNDLAEFTVTRNGYNENVILTKEELHRAFELGFQDIQQICRVKLELGDIEKILY